MTVELRTRVDDLVATGERLGFYEVMSQAPLTAAELAQRVGADVWFVRGWLAEQLQEGYVTFDATTGRYANYCTLQRAA